MRVLYLDTVAGISGDMTVGALLALGLPLEHLRRELARLPVDGYTISATSRHVHAIVATKFEVTPAPAQAHAPGTGTGRGSGLGLGLGSGQRHHHHHRPYRMIRELLEGSSLDPAVRDTALAIFARLATAEGQVHGVPADEVSFHEVGAIDSIVDIVGTAVGIAWLGVHRIHVGPLPLGSGTVASQHGTLPVPGPATVELLRGFPVRLGEGTTELVTPTGAAIVAALATPEAVPPLRITAVGYGAGSRELADRPNVLRMIVGDAGVGSTHERLSLIETNVDDLNPEFYDFVIERLFEAGARDVYLTPVHMKKNRPGVVLSVLCSDGERAALTAIVLAETSSLGVRVHAVERFALAREVHEVGTPYGTVRVKVATAPDGTVNVAPEYDDCRRLAREHGVPLKQVYHAALLNCLAKTSPVP